MFASSHAMTGLQLVLLQLAVLQKICVLGYCNLMGRKVSCFISLLSLIARFILELRTQVGHYNDLCHLQEVSAGRNRVFTTEAPESLPGHK